MIINIGGVHATKVAKPMFIPMSHKKKKSEQDPKVFVTAIVHFFITVWVYVRNPWSQLLTNTFTIMIEKEIETAKSIYLCSQLENDELL